MFDVQIDVMTLKGVALEYVVDLVLSGDESSEEHALEWIQDDSRMKYTSDNDAAKYLIDNFNPIISKDDGFCIVEVESPFSGAIFAVKGSENDCRSTLCRCVILVKTENMMAPFVPDFVLAEMVGPSSNEVAHSACIEQNDITSLKARFCYFSV
ncbi:hypothetical protein PPUJ13061_47250 [Pseudomonas putida]|uniref:hypothetical protein n=1 Tax=Pseudomonas putida TaxID=303 RepID=UPI0013B370BA|nr:hypothetical protein [Pseudomonas putida]WQE52790.1 hypothetical protein U0028_23375 [Pseudomonas putida]GLO04823.1 hypothetical protein PPUJ13061_47250 [Pseudomonas putida]HDS1007306.1 hypothetical protein [Pseudomonas putida]